MDTATLARPSEIRIPALPPSPPRPSPPAIARNVARLLGLILVPAVVLSAALALKYGLPGDEYGAVARGLTHRDIDFISCGGSGGSF